jgi:HSP20 family protein
MNALRRADQLRQLEDLQPGLGSLFRPSPTLCPEGQEEPMAVPAWSPLVDISEDAQEYLIKAELLAVNREDVKVTAEEGHLTIKGERRFAQEAKGKKAHRIERAYENFEHRYSLPNDASSAQVSTEFKDGLLTVHLGKRQNNEPQQEEVVDEATAWWQKVLGTKAVLGQASNRTSPGQSALGEQKTQSNHSPVPEGQ